MKKLLILFFCAALAAQAQTTNTFTIVRTVGATPSWIGEKSHAWTPMLGGGVWYQSATTVNAIAPVFSEYSRPVLIGLRSDWTENGYDVFLNRFDPSAESYNYWTDRLSHEGVMKALAGKNCEFIWSMPCPDHTSAAPYTEKKGAGYRWQQPSYYAAYLQYLTVPATLTPDKIALLPENLPFYTDTNCTTKNAASEAAVAGNWGNLRARRGHPEPYNLKAVIIGIEPYGTAQETMQIENKDSGARYGDAVNSYAGAIKARGLTTPLGLNIVGNYPMSDVQRPWFKPLFDKIGTNRVWFSYLDMHHHYHFGLPADEVNRIFPIMQNVNGFQNWWIPKAQWDTDFTKYLWMYENVRVALKNIGENPARWQLGCAEHGLAITSQFRGNDMGAALHWSLWLAESMRYNATWDLNWNIMEIGFSHAQVHFRDGHLTRTPGHYAYKMAQEFYGYNLLTNSYQSPTFTTGTDNGANYTAPDLTLRVFKNPADDHLHLFVVNKSTNSMTLDGFGGMKVVNWKQLKADSFTAQNPIGNNNPAQPWALETIKTQNVVIDTLSPIPKISVNHIELVAGDKWELISVK